MPATEQDFDQLPEALRLALVECARRQLGGAGDPPALNLSQISEASATPITTINRRYHIALLKLKARARKLDL
jgi:DNA-directed RNA polymerase specialized sigma24 family protein